MSASVVHIDEESDQTPEQNEPMDIEEVHKEDQSVILLDSDDEEESEESSHEVIDIADDEDDDEEGGVSKETLTSEALEKVVQETASAERQHLLEFIKDWAQSSSSFCGRPINEKGLNQLKPIEVDLCKSLDEVKLSGDTDDQEIFVTFESQVKTVHPFNVAPHVPIVFSLISWNIDGLEEKNLENRIKGVLKVLQNEEPDVVYFQEVVPFTLTYLKEHLPQYKILVGDEDGYFIVTLLKISRISYDNHMVLPFVNTVMDRNLLCVQAHIGEVKLNLFNTHLESMKDYSVSRKEQMKICFDKMVSSHSNLNTIFGGDLNARDHEVKATKPTGICDLWEVCGSRQASRWTWNLEENTNKQIPSKPKCRFDRLYIKPSTPAQIVPEEFRLIGKKKVAGMPCFPSDHWGILVRFKVL